MIDLSGRVDGILLLDKPTGPTSNWCLQRVKRLCQARKAGHAGTLDPMASGLLPILLGEATKFAGYVSDAGKCYEATVLLGVRTTTGDLSGEVIDQQRVSADQEAVRAVLARFMGTIAQVPPMHSALKQDGIPLYKLARQGISVPRVAREVTITDLRLTRMQGAEIDLTVCCSKGTYIRALAEDLGDALGCGGTLRDLRRTKVGVFSVADAIALAAFEALTPAGRLGRLLGLDAALAELPSMQVEANEAAMLCNGRAVTRTDIVLPQPGWIRIYERSEGRFLGLCELRERALIPRRLVARTLDLGDGR